ncbi:hypothetical protein M0804_006586 [Polistes exclamans]|nr:hypothetical protein M0804_006586 [Polistes exclamans]
MEHEEEEEEEVEEEEALEGYDADYREGEESLQEETDYRRRVEEVEEDSKKEKKLWSLKECDSLASITDEDDIDEDYTETSEPLLAHPLNLPYARMPRPKFFTNDENIEYVLQSLRKRAPSPIRHVSPRRFDFRAEREKRFGEELRENEIRNDLVESANRISGELMQMVENGVETDRMIGSLVLRLILEEVVLTIDFVDHGIDVRTFLTIATTIALRELKISWPGESNDRKFDENSESLFSPRVVVVVVVVVVIVVLVERSKHFKINAAYPGLQPNARIPLQVEEPQKPLDRYRDT